MASIISAGLTSGTSLNLSGDTSGVLQLASNGTTTAVTIDTSQRVGVGTTSPQRKVSIVGTDGASGQTEGNSRTSLFLDNNGANYLSIFTSTSGDGGVFFSDNGSNNGGMVYETSSDALYFRANNAERMRIDSAGKTLIRLSSSVAGNLQVKNSDGGYGTGIALIENGSNNYWSSLIYDVTHDYYIGYNGTNKGYFASSNGAYTASSDRTLKKEIEPIGYGLNEILVMKPSKFLMSDENVGSKKHLGFIAQDLQEVLPEVVSEMQGGKLGVEATGIIPVLVKAIQELKAELDATKAEVQALKGTL